MIKPGSIVKVSVTNFVTFTYVELTPGQYLNTIVGPNGSGKSTMVAAVILGLGGTPKTVGRGQKVSEYIKHKCKSASITVEMQAEDNSTFSITREFNTLDQSTWLLNNTKKSQKEILEYVRKFNIQVDNLCQFLPQDRVAEFAKLNKQNLLKETLTALCRYDLIEKQENLIQKQNRHKNLTENLSRMVMQRDGFEQANIRMDGKIKSLQKKREYLTKIEHVSRKRLWVLYLKLAERRDQLSQAKDVAVEAYQRHKTAAKPMVDIINKAKEKSREMETQYRVTSSELNKIASALQTDCLHSYKQRIKDINDEKEMRLQEIQQRQLELQTGKKKLDILLQDKLQILEKIGNEASIDDKIQSIMNDSQKLLNAMTNLEHKKFEFDDLKRAKENETRSLHHQLQRLENVKDQRLEHLRRLDAGSHAGTLWLRQNKHLFQEEIFEPFMLEINIINPKHAMYIEKTISFRDKIAFTCTSKQDMNELINHLNVQQNLGVNIVHAEARSNIDQFKPKYRIEELRRYGFQAYLSSLLKAPEPIMNYLRKNYKIHSIPVAFENNNVPLNNIPPEITTFYKGNCRYSISRSKYTKEMSTKQIEIKSDNTLSLSVDQVQIENIRSQIEEIHKEVESADTQSKNLADRITEVLKQKDRVRGNVQVLKNTKQQLENIDARIRVMKNKIDDLNANLTTSDDIQGEFKAKLNQVLAKMITVVKQRISAYANFTVKKKQHKLNEICYDTSRQQITILENKFEDLRNLVGESEIALNKSKEEFSEITRESRTALIKAKEISGGHTPDDARFRVYKEEYDRLPNDIEKLDAEKAFLDSKVDCLINAADQNEVREYEQRAVNIVEMNRDISTGQSEMRDLNENMETLMNEWLEPLKELIAKIHYRFSRCFELMNCVGDISLYTDENERDYEKYGLRVKVTFRNGEPLQELNNVIQSGGERAVATAIFMLSLQELTPVPFRCVDEINQGMDENNERRVHELLVDLTSLPDTSQYFLITPKIADKLKYRPQFELHCVHNGPFTCDQHKWNEASHEAAINWHEEADS